MISFNYLTARKEPCIRWFLSSLNRQLEGRTDLPPFEVNIIDHYCRKEFETYTSDYKNIADIRVFPAHPNPWNGSHQKTRVPYFAPSVFRNTGAIVSRGTYLWFIDDLSVLADDRYISDVLHAYMHKYLCLGTYRKVRNLEVNPDGSIKSYEDFPPGNDTRLGWAGNEGIKAAPGNILYGCSFGLPTNVMEAVNGFDEKYCSTIGCEDVEFGKRVENYGGCKIFLNSHIMTFESEERHFNPEDLYFKRANKKVSEDSPYRVYAAEADWVIVNRMKLNQGCRSENHFDLAEARHRFAVTGEWPPCDPVEVHWPDNQRLETME